MSASDAGAISSVNAGFKSFEGAGAIAEAGVDSNADARGGIPDARAIAGAGSGAVVVARFCAWILQNMHSKIFTSLPASQVLSKAKAWPLNADDLKKKIKKNRPLSKDHPHFSPLN